MCGKTTTYHQIKTYLCSIISRNPIKRDRDMRYSVIIPVYNRPDEVDELLQSLTRQSFKDFEVIIVEDGSSVPCKNVADRYQDILNIRYYSKPNSGPGQTRNYGAERSRGEYLIILDSDCILPEDYFQEVEKNYRKLLPTPLADPTAHMPLLPMCKSHQLLHDFILHHRRYSRREKENGQVLSEELQYGSTPRGLRSTRRLLPDAFWRRHRFQHPHLQRRIQVQAVSRSMGISQTTDGPEEILQASTQFRHCPHQPLQETSRLLEIVHLLPAAFTLGVVVLLASAPFCLYSLLPVALYALLVCTDSAIQNKSLRIGLYSIAASFIQLIGYGTGFWRAWWNRCILGKDEFEAFKKNFYK